jgi:hypothetical protein
VTSGWPPTPPCHQSDRALAADGIVGERTWLSAVSLPGETLDVAAGVAT